MFAHTSLRRAAATAVVLIAASAVALTSRVPSYRSAAASPPRLLVIVVVDQFRADYITTYGRQWTKGLRRLLDDGAVLTSAAYPYANTVTCPGHFTIGTGAMPNTHGMIGNTFYDRALRANVPCADDAAAAPIAFGGGVGKEHHNARALMATTLADELRRQAPRPPNIVALALKPRTAIGLAGHGGPGTVVVWAEDDGTWATSDEYTKVAWPDVDAFVRSHPVAADYGRVWTRLLAQSRYLYADDAPGEASPVPWTRTFPHPLESPGGTPDNTFVTAWERSPQSDAFLTDLALHLIQTRRLGAEPGTDFLAVSFPALDLVGHEFGPRSHEVQDVLARVDVNLGRLLDALDRQVGSSRFVLALTADHGVATIPEQMAADSQDAGRIAAADIRRAANTAVARALNVESGEFVAALNDLQLSLTAGTFERVRGTPGGLASVKHAITAVPGVDRVYDATELAGPGGTDDDLLRRWRLSYLPSRGGDFVITPKRNWIVRAGAGTTHGAPYDYDQHVPLVLFGAGVRRGTYAGASTPADIAPTLAALAGIIMPQAQGRVLTEALRR